MILQRKALEIINFEPYNLHSNLLIEKNVLRQMDRVKKETFYLLRNLLGHCREYFREIKGHDI